MLRGCQRYELNKKLLKGIGIAFIVSAAIASGFGCRTVPTDDVSPTDVIGPAAILVENASFSLQVKPLKPDRVELVEQYDAMLFTLCIREVRGSEEKLYAVGEIWGMTGDDNRDRLVEFIRSTLTDVMEGKSR